MTRLPLYANNKLFPTLPTLCYGRLSRSRFPVPACENPGWSYKSAMMFAPDQTQSENSQSTLRELA